MESLAHTLWHAARGTSTPFQCENYEAVDWESTWHVKGVAYLACIFVLFQEDKFKAGPQNKVSMGLPAMTASWS